MAASVELVEIKKTFAKSGWRGMLKRGAALRTTALDGVSLSLRDGEIFGLLGPNGAGKSTLIKILACLVLPDSGRAKILGHDVAGEPDLVKKNIGLVNASERSFYWRLTGEQNLNFFASLHEPPAIGRKKRVREILELVGLAHKGGEQFMKYSTGQQQRLAIGRALLGNPRILLMDEPTRSLDPLGAADIRAFARRELRDALGRTILWCTHNLREAEQICDRLAVLDKGRVLASGTPPRMRALLDGHGVYRFTIAQQEARAGEEPSAGEEARAGEEPRAGKEARAGEEPRAGKEARAGKERDLLSRCNLKPLRAACVNNRLEFDIQAKEEEIPDVIQKLVAQNARIYECRRQCLELEEVFARLVGGGEDRLLATKTEKEEMPPDGAKRVRALAGASLH